MNYPCTNQNLKLSEYNSILFFVRAACKKLDLKTMHAMCCYLLSINQRVKKNIKIILLSFKLCTFLKNWGVLITISTRIFFLRFNHNTQAGNECIE